MTLKTRLTELTHMMRDLQLAFPGYLSKEERAAVGAPDSWSAKDEVIHCMVWANRALDDLEIIARGETPPERDDGDFEDENRAIFEAHKDDSWEEAQAMIRDTCDRADAFIARNDEETLLSVPEGQERAIWRVIAGNYISHPMIHLWWYLQRHGYDELLVELFGEQFTAKLVSLQDDDGWRGTTYYNQACIYALSGKKEEAIKTLGQALQLVPELVEWSQQDSDLASLRDDPAYQALYE